MPKTRKATKLAEAARERGRARARGRFRESVETPKGYKAAGFSLYSRHLNFVDEVTHALKTHGMPKANKSLVVQQALERLEEDLRGMQSPEGYVQYFLERQAKRTARA